MGDKIIDHIIDIKEGMGEVKGELKGINECLKKMNGNVSANQRELFILKDSIEETDKELSVLKVKAAIYGAGTGTIAGLGGTVVAILIILKQFGIIG